jgi:hypothetical protein
MMRETGNKVSMQERFNALYWEHGHLQQQAEIELFADNTVDST